MRQFFRLLSLTTAIFIVLAYPVLAQQQQVPTARPAAPAATEEFKLSGFRSANFGMNADQVRQAIRRDFAAAADKIETVENAVERTTVLSIQVNDLLPNTGTGVVAYVIGYRSKQLVQVTVTWGGGINPNFKPEQALGAARQLQTYFVGQGYKADTVVTNAQQRDGSIIVFAGDDAQRRRTLLVLGNVTGQDGKPPEGPPVLQLSYIRDPQNPDVFQIRRGDF
jgi:hypothetical protein